jgi:HlyD family secretion protein
MAASRIASTLIAAALAALALASCGGTATTATATATVTRGDLIQSVGGSGQVKPAQDIDLNFGSTGTVAEVRASAGQRVKAGDRLAALETSDLDQQVLQAEANRKSAQAALAALKAGPKETDLRAAEAQLAAAQIQLGQASKGNARGTDLASARAQLRSAQADLAALKNPSSGDLSAAQLRVTQAQTSLQITRDSDSAAKTRAEADLNRAVEALTQAQSRYATASQNWQYVQDTGRDPINPSRTGANGQSVPNKLNDAQRQQYYDAFVQAQSGLRSAEEAVTQAQVAYDSARQKEAADIPLAESQLADAQRQLDALQHPTAQKLAAAEARVAQAQAQLNQLLGGTTNDVAISEATVAQRQAALDALKAPPTERDLAAAEANLAQAEASLARAKLNRAHAELVAPFAGTVAVVNIKVGDSIGASGQTAAIQLVDDSAFHVDVDISEADLGRLKLGQEAQVELDALPGQVLSGTLDYIAPTGTTQQNVTTYQSRVTLKPTNQLLRVGLSAAVSIITDKRTGVLLVPSGAVRETDSGPQAQVKRGSDTALVPIKIGLVGDAQTEVISGLQEGDVVVLPGPRPRNGGFGPPGG